MHKCSICGAEFDDKELSQQHKESHRQTTTDTTTTRKPDLNHIVRANRASFSRNMWRIIETRPEDEKKMIAKSILMHSNGKPRSSDHFKWEKLKNRLPDFTTEAYEIYQKKYPRTRNFVTIDNYSDGKTLLDLAAKKKPKPSTGKMAEILEKLDAIEKRLTKLEKN